MSYMNELVRYAYIKGYRVDILGRVISFTGKFRKVSRNNKCSKSYYRFTVRFKDKWGTVFVHKLQAYQKYGNKSQEKGIEVRHLDGNSLNNHRHNIAIGSHIDNMLDKSPETRRKASIEASTYLRVITDEDILVIRDLYFNQRWTYKELMAKYNVKAKSSMWEFIHRKYVTKK